MRKVDGIILMTTEEAVKFIERVLKDDVILDRATRADRKEAELAMESIMEFYDCGCYAKAVFWIDELYRLAGYDVVRRVKVE